MYRISYTTFIYLAFGINGNYNSLTVISSNFDNLIGGVMNTLNTIGISLEALYISANMENGNK